jgi:hypothetical protein
MRARVRLILASLLLLPAIIMSIGSGSTYAASASGLSISPLRQNLTLKPGQAGAINITLKNITGGPIIAKSSVKDFSSDNLNGNPKIITNTNYNDPASIKKFLIGLGNVPLAVGQQTNVTIPVQAPSNAAPGAYYGLIAYQAIPVNSNGSTGNNAVSLSAAVSQLVFITVPGVTNDHLQINSVNTYHDVKGVNSGVFFTKPPKAVGVNLHNYGNAFGTPYGTVIIQNSSGKQIYSYQLNGGITRGLLLPNSNRTFVNPVYKIHSPGRYTVIVNASYGSGSDVLTAKKSFWYIPVWLIVILILVVLIIIAAIVYVRMRYKHSSQKRYHR